MKRIFVLLLLLLTFTSAVASAADWKDVVDDLRLLCHDGGSSLDSVVDKIRYIAIDAIEFFFDDLIPVELINGESKTINLPYINPNDILELKHFVWDGDIIDLVIEDRTDGDYPVTITAKGVGQTELHIYLDTRPDKSWKLPIFVSMSEAEAAETSKVYYCWYRDVFNYPDIKEFTAFYGLTDEYKNELHAPAYITLKIVNDNNETVFNDYYQIQSIDYAIWTTTDSEDHLLAALSIPYTDLSIGTSPNGTVEMYIELYDGSYFDPYYMPITNLPWQPK